MGSVTDPRLEHFKPEPANYTQRLAIGPKFLATLFISNSTKERKQRFSRELLKWVKNGDIAYKRLLVNQHVLDEAATHLKKKGSPDDAFNCVKTTLSSEIFEICRTDSEEFEEACHSFCKFDDHDGAMTDFLTKTFLENSETSYLATWDGHYQAFKQVKPLPRCDY